MGVFAALISTVCYALVILIFVRVAFSWISRDFTNPIYRFSFQLTEPLLRPVRNLLPGGMGGLDFSPMVVSFGLLIIVSFVNRLG
ncbi:MAG: YggT family protein [Chloroflexi bacterium]|nr:MAG: YggT family protein [Chloroflexota bacterium]TMD51353.1 MAG: YggT family protein [Chloroflexota bacterium]